MWGTLIAAPITTCRRCSATSPDVLSSHLIRYFTTNNQCRLGLDECLLLCSSDKGSRLDVGPSWLCPGVSFSCPLLVSPSGVPSGVPLYSGMSHQNELETVSKIQRLNGQSRDSNCSCMRPVIEHLHSVVLWVVTFWISTRPRKWPRRAYPRFVRPGISLTLHLCLAP